MEVIPLIFIVSLLFSSLVVLSLSMRRHYEQIRQQPLSKTAVQPIRRAGWLLMATSLGMCFYHLGFGIGFATFFAIISFVGFAQIALLTYAPKTLIPLGLIMPLTSGLALFIA